MALQTRYKLDPLVLEAGGGEILVETAGYVPADIRIKEFIEAGIRLADYRREAYDFGPDDEPDMEEALAREVAGRLKKTAMTVLPEKEESAPNVKGEEEKNVGL